MRYMAGVYLHEDLHRKHKDRRSSDRSFGIVFALFFLLVSLAPLRRHQPVRWWALALSLLFLALALLRPVWLRALNAAWAKIGILMGRVVSPVVSGLLFFGVVTPTGLLLRLLGKDPLRLAPDRPASTYWIERRPPGPAPQTMSSQF